MKILIGIDPGVNTGVATYSRPSKKLLDLKTTDFWGAYDYVISHPIHTVRIYIETPNSKRPMYADSDKLAGGRQRVAELMASRIGSNRREATLLADRLESLGYMVERVKPITEKWDAATFKLYTKFTGRCSQHARDAAKLVYGL